MGFKLVIQVFGSHFFYVDDVVLVTEWNRVQMDNIIRVLNVFFLTSRLRININKSNVYGIEVLNEEVEDMARLTGCKLGSFPFTYLGLPIGSNMSRLTHCQGFIDKFNSRLSKWKVKLLSIGGRSTLVKAVLGSVGIYYMSLFKVPESTLSGIERLVANPNSLWDQVIKAIHGEEARFNQNRCKTNGVYSKIVGSIIHLHSSGIVPKHILHYKLGCGMKVRFQKDNWIGDTPLAQRYNKLFRLDPEPNYMLSGRYVNGEWNLKWIRPIISGRNLDYLASLTSELEQVVSFEGQDELRWSLGYDGTFTAKYTRHHIDDTILPTLETSTVWCKNIPRKVNIFLWRLRLDRLPLRLNLSKRGLYIQSIMCPLCSNGVESNDHLLFMCEVA
nr:putative RNA-directed DNA polymerase, eukaryota, reverse transcriptase zinc-binding domain protein [Tanacetum cinerariifolium]